MSTGMAMNNNSMNDMDGMTMGDSHNMTGDHGSMTGDHGSMHMSSTNNNFCGAMSDMDGMSHGSHSMSSAGMAMYMDGFRSSFATDSNTPCLNLFFPSWTLDTEGKFVAAMFGVIFLSILTEGVAAIRLRLHKRMRPGPSRKIFITVLHGVQAFMGYILMMVTMTFSIELILCVCFGLALGYAAFFADESDVKHVTTNPCCAFMEGEAVEADSPSPEATEMQKSSTSTMEEGKSECCDAPSSPDNQEGK